MTNNRNHHRDDRRSWGNPWRDVDYRDVHKLKKAALRCPRCSSTRIKPLDLGSPQMLCEDCLAILSMTQQCQLKLIGAIVDGHRCYFQNSERAHQEQRPPVKFRRSRR